MLYRTVPSPKGALSPHEILRLAEIYLENASKEENHNVCLVLCHNAEVALSQAKSSSRKSSTSALDPDEQAIRDKIAVAYYRLGKLLENNGHRDEAEAFYKKCKKWGGHVPQSDQPSSVTSGTTTIVDSTWSATSSISDLTSVGQSNNTISFRQPSRGNSFATTSSNIFPKNLDPPATNFQPPEPDSRLKDTPQLAYCLALLQTYEDPTDVLDTATCNWIQMMKSEPDEHERLQVLATDVIRAFKRDEIKDTKAVAEVIYLAPVLEKDDFRYLLKEFHVGIEQSSLLDIHQLEGLAQLIQGADTCYLDADDLVKVLSLLSTRLQGTHHQSPQHLYQLTLAVSNVLDAMADAEVKGLDRERIHEPLLSYLDGLRNSSDPYLVYQAAYAYQALLYVPDNESIWQATLRRTGKVMKGVSGLVSAVKSLDLNGFIEGLAEIQQGLAGANEVVKVVKNAYEGAASLAESGQKFFDCLKDGLCFSRKSAWYPALRGADSMIQEGRFAEFRILVCEAPCRRDMAFQWGVCQRLADIAGNSTLDSETRQGAILFLAEIYKDDNQWGQHVNIKQWILNILMQLSSGTGDDTKFTESILNDLRRNGGPSKQTLYRSSRERGPGPHPLKVGLPTIGSPSLLDRVQGRPDVEGNLRQQRRQRLKERGMTVYIPPQAKSSLQAHEEECFPLMEKVNEFLESDEKVFLLLGDSGAGKSTFNRELECQLWQRYKKKTGPIPLHISLPAIDKPEYDMIAKQLRKLEFTEPQIRELKLHRTFILICDGYDECQQTHNLYTSNRLNQAGEWKAKMVISCRTESLGVDYRDRFQPGDRNQRSESSTIFQEAVIIPFSISQVQEYINQYVSLHRPLWEASDYKKALDLIPSLKDLVRNPFLMSLSLEVLPRIVDPTQNLSATQITRVALYDQFVEHWLERGKKRLGERNLGPQAKAAYESLTDEGFTRNGIAYMKRLSAGIYKEQEGQPVVSYSRYKDENTWKAEFFCREEEKQLLREACPLIRNGVQHRFIHRSLLEYGVALAIFDPRDWKERKAQDSAMARRGSAGSVMSFVGRNPLEKSTNTFDQEIELDSPLVWRSFVNEPSVLQFLEERVQQEPLFKKQLLDYIERSKVDKKWRTAAANAITILVRYGLQFNHADFRGIQIPGADLSYGVFEAAQLQGADLRQVVLRGAWLEQADLGKAHMSGARFGELPYLEQDSGVSECICSPDGKLLFVGFDNGIIIAYLTSTWEIRWKLEGHKDAIMSLVYSPKSNRIASGSQDKTARIWDVDDGECKLVLSGHAAFVRSVAFSPGGDLLLTGSSDKKAMLWDASSGKCLSTLAGHEQWIFCVSFSPNGKQVITSSRDRTIRIWNVGTGECSLILNGHTREARSAMYSSRGDRIVSVSDDGTVRLWDPITGDCQRIITGQDMDYPNVIFSPKGDQVVSVGTNNSIKIWDPESGLCLNTLLGHTGPITSITYSFKGDLIASTSKDKTIRLWDSATGLCRQTFSGHSSWVKSAVFLPKGDRIVSLGADKTVRLWDVGAEISRHISSGHREPIWSIKCSSKGQFATASRDTTVRLWNLETGNCIHIMAGHTGWVRCVAFAPQGDNIVSVSDDRTVKLWDVVTGECTHVLTDHTLGVFCVAFSPNGDQFATGSDDCTARLWDTETKECRHVLHGHDKRIWRIDYSPQGDILASASADCTVRLWDTTTGVCRSIIIGHSTVVRTVVWSPVGNQLAFSCEDGSIRLWDVEAGMCLHTMRGHILEVKGIVYSPRGDMAVSTSADRTVRLWDVATGKCRSVLRDFQNWVCDIDWLGTLDANYLVVGCYDGEVRVWKVVEEDGNEYNLRLFWRKTKGELTVKGTIIQDVHGLSQLNKHLLKQRGAEGDPADRFREVNENVMKMASVITKLKATPNETAQDPSSSRPDISMEQLERRVEQVSDPLLRGLVAAFVRDIHG